MNNLQPEFQIAVKRLLRSESIKSKSLLLTPWPLYRDIPHRTMLSILMPGFPPGYFFITNSKKTMASKQRIRIKIKSFDHKVIDEAVRLIIDTAERTGAIIAGPIPLPMKIEKFTVNTSTFVNKDSRDQYEIRTHKRLIDLRDSTPKTIEQLSNLSLPAGVDIEIKMIAEETTEEEK